MDRPVHFARPVGPPYPRPGRTGPFVVTLVLTTVIFAADLSTRPGIDIGVLYVVPLLIGSVGAPPRFVALAAWFMSALIVGGLLRIPWATLPWLAFVNRAIALGLIWTTASILYRFRQASQRLEERTRDLADMSDALEQSAIVAATDITDRKRSEELLREQATLARLGEMAAVVAHEVRNPIAGIRGALQVILSRMPAGQRDRAVMSDVISRLDSLDKITDDLLQFARPRQLRAEPTEIGGLIASTADLMRRDPAFAGIEVRVEGPPVKIEADRDQLQMVFQNILINAAQAMAGVGTIEVTISGAPDGGCRVVIVDRGPGMTADVRAKAFEPFFTTKHRGTGLGLAIARRVITGHGGQIRIDTPPAGGTAITIELPEAR